MNIKTLIIISLSILFTLVLSLGIIAVPTTAVLADQIAPAQTQVVTPTTDSKPAKNSEKPQKALNKNLPKKADSIPPIKATPAQCNCDCGRGALSGGRVGGRCICIMGCTRFD